MKAPFIIILSISNRKQWGFLDFLSPENKETLIWNGNISLKPFPNLLPFYWDTDIRPEAAVLHAPPLPHTPCRAAVLCTSQSQAWHSGWVPCKYLCRQMNPGDSAPLFGHLSSQSTAQFSCKPVSHTLHHQCPDMCLKVICTEYQTSIHIINNQHLSMHEFSIKLACYHLKERDVSDHSFSLKCTFLTFSAVRLPACLDYNERLPSRGNRQIAPSHVSHVADSTAHLTHRRAWLSPEGGLGGASPHSLMFSSAQLKGGREGESPQS